MLGRRALLGLGAGALAAPVIARASAAPKPPRLFVRIDFEAKYPVRIDEALDPGRVEVWSGSEFVGCALAPVHVDAWDYHWLAPLSLGLIASGPASAIKVNVYGELSRAAKKVVRVSEHGPS